ILSQAQYSKIRLVLTILDVVLPDWGTLRRVKEKLKERLSINVWENISPLGNVCYGLSMKEMIKEELANPLVSQELVFYPEYKPGSKINCLAQSKKWQDGNTHDLHVPMVETAAGHFY
ncbi:hypothetical protein CROQUDRAFT_23421, partial [Cronartium quercuum f. sp. fusiforme G11]